MTTKEYYFDKWNIDRTKAAKRALVKNENGIKTAMTEMLGEAIIKHFHLWDVLFPENTGYKKVTAKKLQKAGVDYEVYDADGEPIYIDIKVCVGPDYSMKEEDFNGTPARMILSSAVPIEIYQNNVFTNTKGKLTDYLLYIIAEDKGISYCLLNYEDVQKISVEHKKTYEIKDSVNGKVAVQINKGAFKWHISNNGSGTYIKFPVNAVRLSRAASAV